MAKGEFENRDRDEMEELSSVPLAGDLLGELSDGLARERGELDSYNVDPGIMEQPDMARLSDAREQAANTGLGSPKLDFTVRSVFDSRPTSAKEFNLWFGVDWPSSADYQNYDALRQCFYVPSGFVACLRRVEVFAEIDGANMNPWDGYLQIMADNAVRDPIDAPDGPASTGGSLPAQIPGVVFTLPARVDTFILVDERLSIGALLNFSTNFDRPNLRVGFHGTFLLKTGVPAMFQAANLAQRAPSAKTVPTGEILSGADLMRTRKRKRQPFGNVPLVNQLKR